MKNINIDNISNLKWKLVIILFLIKSLCFIRICIFSYDFYVVNNVIKELLFVLIKSAFFSYALCVILDILMYCDTLLKVLKYLYC